MENNQNNYHINPIIAIAVILQLVFMIFAVITIHNLLEPKTEFPEIKIDDYSAIPDGKIINEFGQALAIQDIEFDSNNGVKNAIGQTIYNVVTLNNKGNIPNNGAKIREGSAHYVYIEDSNTYFLGFIVDIEDLKQSYRFAWLQPTDPSGQIMIKKVMMAFCLKEDEMIYGNFDCKDNYNGHGLDIVTYNLIRDHSFSNFSIALSDIYVGDPLKITIQLFPKDGASKATAVQELSEYLSESGINLDDFEYDFTQLFYAPIPYNSE